jgi:sec-independent protein translocase protein TatC
MAGKDLVKAVTEKGKNLEAEMSFFDHLEALRWHIIRAVIAIAIFFILAFWQYSWIYNNIIMGPMHPNFWSFRMMCSLSKVLHMDGFCIDHINAKIINTEVAGQFLLQVNSSFMIGIILGIPYILWEIWKFIKPALLEKERKAASGFVFYASTLFVVGILFGYYILVPESIAFLAGYTVGPDINNMFTISSYLSIVGTITLLTGILFELPIIIYVLASIGVITGSFMRRTRRYAIIIIMVVGAVVSPSPDILTTTLATIPLLILYEVGIVVASTVEKRRLRKHEELMRS